MLTAPKQRLICDYDFGDGWEHDVVLERVAECPAGRPRVRVTGGEGACPPEDVGGIGGHYGFLEAINDPKHPEHEDMLEWCEDGFDSTAFDLESVNERLRARVRRR